MAVPPSFIVEGLDVGRDVHGREIASLVDVLLDSLLLQAAEEGLCHRVVQAVAFSAHAWLQSVGFAEALPRVASVLRPLVRVNDGVTRPLIPDRHPYGIEDHLPMYRRTGGPADDSS